MALFARKTESLAFANILLKGGIIGGKDLRNEDKQRGGVYDLNGKTLSFNAAAETVTFVAASAQVPLTTRDILDQINTALSAREARLIDGNLAFIDSDYSAAIILDATSTAAPLLGFADGQIDGKLYSAPGGALPSLVALGAGFSSDSTYLLITDE
jgi:hypothetical protein